MISVIVPYDIDRGFLSHCIRSIKMQTYGEFEIIEARGDNPVAVNFNMGLSVAKGKYCKFVTEDDWLPEKSLEYLIEGIQGHDWICANAEQHDNGSVWLYRPGDYAKDFLTLEENASTNRIHGGTTLYKTDILRKIGGMNETLWTGEEYEMHLRLMSKGYMPGYIDKSVYCHRLWNGQKSKKLRKKNRYEREKEIKRIQSLYTD